MTRGREGLPVIVPQRSGPHVAVQYNSSRGMLPSYNNLKFGIITHSPPGAINFDGIWHRVTDTG